MIGRIRWFFSTWWHAIFLPIGWTNRVVLIAAVVSIVFVAWMGNWVSFWLYCAIWLPFTLQFTLNDVYRRGRDAGEAQTFKRLGFEQLMDQDAGEQLLEAFELSVNQRIVALHDMRELCEKYDVPMEEMQPIVRRAFG